VLLLMEFSCVCNQKQDNVGHAELHQLRDAFHVQETNNLRANGVLLVTKDNILCVRKLRVPDCNTALSK
jgi:hypothetical protein